MLTLEQIDSIEKYLIPNLLAGKQKEAAETIKQLCNTVRALNVFLGWSPESDSTQASGSEIHEEI